MHCNRTLLTLAFALALVAASGAGLPAIAQEDENPFGGTAAPEAAEKKDVSAPSVDPLAAEREHPVIRQLRESNPKTLDGLTRALRITMQLDRADEFKIYAKSWLALKPTDAQLAALQRKYGSAMFYEFGRLKPLQPEGDQIADIVLEAAAKYTRDPARLKELVSRLGTPQKATAVRALREAGSDGILAMFTALASDAMDVDRAAIRDTLVLFGRDVIRPSIAALSAPQANLRADAAEVLGRLGAGESTIYLVGLAATDEESPDRAAARAALERLGVKTPSTKEAGALLAQRIRGLLAGELPGKLDENDHIAAWRWDAETQTARYERYPAAEASLLAADRLAQQLLPLAKDSPSNTRLALLVRLEADKTVNGLDLPLPQGNDTAWALAQSLGVNVVEATLAEAIKLDRPTAIAALLEVIGASGRPELLTKYPSAESPIVTALGYPDRRVQFAALKAILELDPVEAFPGASRVVETMSFLLTSDGQPRILVGHPRPDEVDRIGALYSELGYEADSASTGSALIRQAKRHSGYELILISETIDGPNVLETAQALRKDPRTARIPVGILPHYLSLEPRYVPGKLDEHSKLLPLTKEEERLIFLGDDEEGPDAVPFEELSLEAKQARLVNRRHAQKRLPGALGDLAAETVDLAVVVPLPRSPEALYYTHDQLMRLAPTRHLPADLRLEQASFVLDALSGLMARRNSPKFYDWLQLEDAVEYSLHVPALAPQAITVMSYFGSPKAQLTLVEQASLPARPIEERQAAAKAFEEAVKQRGVGLSPAQIAVQYERLKTAPNEESKQVLSQVISTIEAPTAAKREANRKLLESIKSSYPRPELIEVEKRKVRQR